MPDCLRRGSALEPEESSVRTNPFPSFGDGQARKDPTMETFTVPHVTRQAEEDLRPSVEVDIFEVPDDVCTYIAH